MARVDVTDSTVTQDMTDANNNFIELYNLIAGLAAGASCPVSSNDQVPGVLDGKLLAGSGITFTIGNEGANETLTISVSAVLADESSPALSAELDGGGNTIKNVVFEDVGSKVNPLGTLTGGTTDISLEDGNVVTATISTGTQTFTFSDPPPSGTEGYFTFFLTHDGIQEVNFPSSVQWSNDVEPDIDVAGLYVFVFATLDGGTTWPGFLCGEDMK